MLKTIKQNILQWWNELDKNIFWEGCFFILLCFFRLSASV